MVTTLLTLVFLMDFPRGMETPRDRNPLAPSLPLLTENEEQDLDRLLDRVIAADLHQLPEKETQEAFKAFRKLGSEAIPALIRGLNRAARIEGSCPALIFAKKLGRFLSATRDRELLDFARENIGSGVGQTRHAPLLQDLRLQCTTRKAALSRNPSP